MQLKTRESITVCQSCKKVFTDSGLNDPGKEIPVVAIGPGGDYVRNVFIKPIHISNTIRKVFEFSFRKLFKICGIRG